MLSSIPDLKPFVVSLCEHGDSAFEYALCQSVAWKCHNAHLHQRFNGRFPGEPGLASSAPFLPPLVLEKNLWG